MLNRQIQVKISLLGLTRTANVSKVFPNVPGEINLGAFPEPMVCCVLSNKTPLGALKEASGGVVTEEGAKSWKAESSNSAASPSFWKNHSSALHYICILHL